MARVKEIKLNGEYKIVSIDKFNEMVEEGIKFEDLGSKEV